MSYEQGFIEKCAQYGVNPQELVKYAQQYQGRALPLLQQYVPPAQQTAPAGQQTAPAGQQTGQAGSMLGTAASAMIPGAGISGAIGRGFGNFLGKMVRGTPQTPQTRQPLVPSGTFQLQETQ